MRDERFDLQLTSPRADALNEVMRHLERLVIAGLQHGHFTCTITCEIGSGGRRNIVIQGGNSHRFGIPADALQR